MFGLAIALLSTVMGAYVGVLSLRLSRAPTLREHRWFGCAAFAAAGFAGMDVFTMGGSGPVALVPWATRLQLVFGALHLLAWLPYADALLGRRSRLATFLGALSLAGAGLALVPGLAFDGSVAERTVAGLVYREATASTFGDLEVAALVAGMLVLALRFAAGWRRGVPRAGLHALALGALCLMALNDGLVLARLYDGVYLLDIGFILPVAAVGYSLATRVVEESRTLARLRGHLEREIADRSVALARSEAARRDAEKLAALGQLSAGVAHEVNNPAAILSANLRYLAEVMGPGRPAPQDALECLRESEQAVDRIARIVRQLLDTSRIAVRGEARAEPVELGRAAAEAVRLARARCPDADLSADVPAGLVALGVDSVLVQVLVNLLVNGAQAARPGARGRARIRAAAPTVEGRVALAVEDDGVGMTPEVLARVFEPFFSTKPFGAGTGLGLAVSRGLVAGLGGELRLESWLGTGTCAFLELPAAPAGAEVAANEPTVTPIPLGARRSLLIVDDEPAVRAALARLLGGAWEVVLAGGVDEGLRLARSRRFDLLLCDVMMPDGGAERLAAILDAERLPAAARLVFLTGGAVTREARSFIDRERRPVLPKPLDPAALVAILERLEGSTSAA